MTRLLRRSTSEILRFYCILACPSHKDTHKSKSEKQWENYRCIEIFLDNLTKEERSCHFLSGNFPSLLQPQRSTLQPVLAAALGTQAHPNCSSQPSWCSLRRLRRANLTFGKLTLEKLHIWEVCFLGNCHLGSRPWENAFGKNTQHLKNL